MNLRNAAGAMSRFAHLSGLARPSAKAAEDEKPEDKKEDEKDAAAEDEKPEDEDDKKKDAKAAEDDDAPDPGPEDDKDEGKPEPKDKEGKAAYADGFKAAQARGAAIFGHAAAAGNPALAAELAFNHTMAASAAVALMGVGVAAPARAGLASRMAAVPPINIGADAPNDAPATKASAASALASTILAAARADGLKL